MMCPVDLAAAQLTIVGRRRGWGIPSRQALSPVCWTRNDHASLW